MFQFLSQDSFYLWLGIGLFIAVVGGFASVSQGAFFRRVAGQVFIAFCFFTFIGVIVKIGWSNSIIAALVSLFVFWCAMGLGGRLFVRAHRRIV